MLTDARFLSLSAYGQNVVECRSNFDVVFRRSSPDRNLCWLEFNARHVYNGFRVFFG